MKKQQNNQRKLIKNAFKNSNGRFTKNPNSLRQRIFSFLTQHPLATNQLLYIEFHGNDKKSKNTIITFKNQFLLKYKNIITNTNQQPYTIQHFNKDHSKKLQHIIDKYDKFLPQIKKNQQNPFLPRKRRTVF